MRVNMRRMMMYSRIKVPGKKHMAGLKKPERFCASQLPDCNDNLEDNFSKFKKKPGPNPFFLAGTSC